MQKMGIIVKASLCLGEVNIKEEKRVMKGWQFLKKLRSIPQKDEKDGL